MKRQQAVFSIQTSLRGRTVRRKSMNRLGGVEGTAYTYNVRSWPTRIAGQHFTERLCYNGPVEGLDTSRPHRYHWNGTVAAYAWKTAGETRQRGYSLMYDGLDRLTAAYLESDDTYYVELHDGHLSQWYDQQYDIESVAFHESRHRYDESTREPVIGEIIAVLQQMKHPNWKYTSSEFKVGQLNYALNELNKLKKDEETIMKLKNLLINSLGAQFNQSDNTIESNLNDIIVTPNK